MASLLTLLAKDFSGKTTVKECLRQCLVRGEGPSPEVKKALQDKDLSIDKSTITISKGLILKSFMELKQAGGGNKSQSSMQHFSTVIAACQWIQFLCEYSKKNNPASASTAGAENESPQEDNQKNSILYTDAEVQTMTKQILLSLSGVIAFLVKEAADKKSADNDSTTIENDNDDVEEEDIMNSSATESFDPRQLAVFAFVSIIRLNSFVDERPAFLGVIWKSLEEIAAAVTDFPDEVGTMVFKDLIHFLNDGAQELLALSWSSNPLAQSTTKIKDSTRLVNQCKVLKFVLARIVRFCDMPLVAKSLFRKSRMKSLVLQLSLLLGIVKLSTADKAGNNDSSSRDHLTQIAKRSKGVIASLLRGTEQDPSLLGMLNQVICAGERNANDADTSRGVYAVTALAAGKLSIHFQLLDYITSKSRGDMSISDVECALLSCEDNLFVNLPRIVFGQTSLTDGAMSRTTAQETLSSIVHCLMIVGKSCAFNVTEAKSNSQRFHFLLIAWLHRVAGEDCHPLSREIYLASLCQYCSWATQNGSESPLVVITDLLFDVRTHDDFRRCLAELVLRLSAYEISKATLDRLITSHAETLMGNLQATSRKRKRKHRQSLAPQSLVILFPVLARLQRTTTHKDGDTTISLLLSGPITEKDLVSQVEYFNSLSTPTGINGNRMNTEAFGVLQLVEQYCRAHDSTLSAEAIRSIVGLLTVCCDNDSTVEFAIHTIAIAADHWRGNLTKMDCDKILGIFHQAFRSDSWPLSSSALTSFVVFATKVPPSFKHSLPDCLPDRMKSTFKRRVKRESPHIDVIRDQKKQHNLSFSNMLRSRGQSLFSTYSSMELIEGSYVLKMSTVDKREAIVIFPPGRQSLEDMEYMLRGQDESQPFHKIRRIFLTEEGCKLSLLENEE